MELSFTDEQDMLRESIRAAIEREAPLRTVRAWVLGLRPPDARPALNLAARQGWTGIGIPEQAGGQGGGVLELAILAEELGRGAVPADGLYGGLLSAQALLACDDTDARVEVEGLATGAVAGALGRPGDRPLDAEAPEGRLALVAGAPLAALLPVVVGSTLHLHSPASTTITPRMLIDRTRSVADVEVVGDPIAVFDGFPAHTLSQLAAVAAVIIAADALGAAHRMLDLTVDYVRQRVQFGVPVGSFQAVKHAASEMLVAIEGTRAAVHYAAWAVGAGEPGAGLDAWVAKARAGQAASAVADKALFLHGAIGYTWEHDLHLLIKRAKSDAELFGASSVYLERVADELELAPSGEAAVAPR